MNSRLSPDSVYFASYVLTTPGAIAKQGLCHDRFRTYRGIMLGHGVSLLRWKWIAPPFLYSVTDLRKELILKQ
jgi:hypothetical protein